MLTNCIFFLILSTGSIFAAAVFNRKYEEAVPLTLFSIITLLYFCGVWGFLKAGVYIVLILCALLYAASLWIVYRHKSFAQLCKNTFTPAFFIFAALFALFNFADAGMLVHNWDEFSHWADTVKVMWSLDDFGTNPAANTLFPSYPPAMSLMQYFLQVLDNLLTGQKLFSEWRLYLVYQTACAALFMPFLKNVDTSRTKLAPAVYSLSALLLPTVMFVKFFHALYIDAFLGLLAGFGLAYVFHAKTFDALRIATLFLSIFVLVLTKAAGILFAVAICALFILRVVSEKNVLVCSAPPKPDRRWVVGTLIVAAVAVVVVADQSWDYVIARDNAAVSFSNPIAWGELWAVFFADPEKVYRRVVLRNYAMHFFEPAVKLGNSNMMISNCMRTLCYICGFYLIWKRYANQEAPRKTQISLLCGACGTLAVIYIIGLCVTYMFKFSEYEAVRLASYERYMNILYLSLLFVSLTCVWDLIGKKNLSARSIALLLSVLCLLTSMDVVFRFVVQENVRQSRKYRSAYTHVEEICAAIPQESAHIQVIAQATTGEAYYTLRYCLRPQLVGKGAVFSIGEPFYEGDVWTRSLTAAQWQTMLASTYDYVVLYRLNDYFYENFSSVFYDPASIGEERLYSVDAQGMLTFVQ